MIKYMLKIFDSLKGLVNLEIGIIEFCSIHQSSRAGVGIFV